MIGRPPLHTGCSVEDCEGSHHSRSFCRIHYTRLKKHGDLTRGRTVGRKWLDSHGYTMIVVDGRSVREHTYVMEQHLGRALLSEENVHHRNGDRSDNRLDNLELWSKRQPAGQRVEDKVTYAREILDLYGDLFDN